MRRAPHLPFVVADESYGSEERWVVRWEYGDTDHMREDDAGWFANLAATNATLVADAEDCAENHYTLEEGRELEAERDALSLERETHRQQEAREFNAHQQTIATLDAMRAERDRLRAALDLMLQRFGHHCCAGGMVFGSHARGCVVGIARAALEGK